MMVLKLRSLKTNALFEIRSIISFVEELEILARHHAITGGPLSVVGIGSDACSWLSSDNHCIM